MIKTGRGIVTDRSKIIQNKVLKNPFCTHGVLYGKKNSRQFMVMSQYCCCHLGLYTIRIFFHTHTIPIP